jgi:hypothetical protein
MSIKFRHKADVALLFRQFSANTTNTDLHFSAACNSQVGFATLTVAVLFAKFRKRYRKI